MAIAKPAQRPTNAKPAQRPSYVEEVTYDVPMDDSILPSLKIIQSLSPERIKGSPEYVVGAEDGMIFNSATRELYDGDNGVVVIPISVRKYWVEWKDRNTGGGFVASYNSKEEVEAGYTPGNEVQVTIEYLVLIEGNNQPITVRFNSATKYAIARKWAQMIEQAKTMYGKKYRLKAVMKTNKNKQIYYNFDIESMDWTDKPLYELAKSIAASTPHAQIGTDI